MTDAQTLELLAWVSREPRTYAQALEVWRTHCPRHPVWEDALRDGLIRIVRNGRESRVVLTPAGAAAASGVGRPDAGARS